MSDMAAVILAVGFILQGLITAAAIIIGWRTQAPLGDLKQAMVEMEKDLRKDMNENHNNSLIQLAKISNRLQFIAGRVAGLEDDPEV